MVRATVQSLTVLFLLLSPLLAHGQQPILPPELKWWLVEVQKANPAISLGGFGLTASESQPLSSDSVSTDRLYPVFRRWNYSGDRFAYYDLGMFLRKQPDGRYSVSADIDSELIVVDRHSKAIFRDSFGSSKGINGVSWLRDAVLVATGVWIRRVNPDKYVVDLFVRQYTFGASTAQVNEYTYKDAFDADVRSGLSLNWWEQRPDYFSGR